MSRMRVRAAMLIAAIAVICAVAGAVAAITQPSDEEALQPSRPPADATIEAKVNDLVADMTLEEKLEQVTLLPDFKVAGEAGEAEVRKGLGAILSLTDPARIRRLQEIAVKESPHHIPLLFAFDTIHGFRTIFPIPLGTAASFDPQQAKNDGHWGSFESTAVGLKQTYAPMVDVSHEPRWGRISEGAGEDPYLGSVMAAARVKGIQGSQGDYSAARKEAASPKHFAAYGEPEGGRDYNTTDMSLNRLWNFYLPPFKAAIDAGADTAMCSFNSLNGVPGCANKYTMTDVLKGEWNFDGFVEADWAAVEELRSCPPKTPNTGDCGHGVAGDGPSAAALAFNAGLDSEMTSTLMRDFGADLISSGAVSMARLDDAVRRILRVKFRAGLFENPYAPVPLADTDKQMLTKDAVDDARKAAEKSMVLLKNDGGVLPFDASKRTAVIGPLGDGDEAASDMLGPWWGVGRKEDAVTVFDAIKARNPNTRFAQACDLSNDDEVVGADEPEGCNTFGPDFRKALATARWAQQVVVTVGETREMSGEAESRSNIDLPGRQEDLIRALVATKRPVAVVLFNGRPLALENVIDDAPAWLEAWFPGVQAGPAVANVVFGADEDGHAVNPGGKLPVSFPVRVGQVPIYYNHEPTGRPCSPTFRWNSRYRDLKTCDPLFVFGHGLSYTTFEVTDLSLDASSVPADGSVKATVTVKNTGARTGDDVVQLYIHDPVASLSQPVRRLRGFQRVTLGPGQTEQVTFTLDKSDFGFFDNSGKLVVEPGVIDVYAGDSSSATLTKSFTVTG
jgi:beta-glucosidase